MPELVADCPRCGSRQITFDLVAATITEVRYGWQNWYEAFGLCRRCLRTTIFVLSESVNRDYHHLHKVGLLKLQEAVNNYVDVESYISLKDRATVPPPEHTPKNLEAVFREGATCLAVGCNNAAGTMFRLCVDLATRPLLPAGEAPGLNAKTRRDLGLRLPWLFDNHLLPEAVRELSTCIKDDGNDGAHAGTLTRAEAEDLLDFTRVLFERLYTEPERLRLAQERRESRRSGSKG
jgi:Domain of unknown function (DUF4145)